ncbi:hypothetical protein CWS43_08430 [Rahnella sp. AA]|nr:hypothetical protein CWS43_08430 [Rahnella sp. AA]
MIYQRIAKEVEIILDSLSLTTSDDSLQQANNNATEILQKFQINLNNNIAELQKNAEWDTFTIAFYGETNAGKSTLIESLRIILKEESKVAQQRAFIAFQHKHKLSDENISRLKTAMSDLDLKIRELAQAAVAVKERYAQQESELQVHIDTLASLIAAHHKQSNLWQKFLNLWVKTPEQKEQAHSRENLLLLGGDKSRELGAITHNQNAAEAENKALALEYAGMEAHFSHLNTLSDGVIIGDGRSDFTLDTTHYHFTANNQKFALLDVPGIEGKENKVREQIHSAVQKAHAVFYVTGKATAPQKGDDNTQGTLEKIKEHLNAQTEVWTLFNKRITNPLQLNRPTLVSEDEQESLTDLNTKMQEQLGDNYRDVVPLSALPAFLSVAEHLVPNTENAKKREKLLEKYDVPQVLEKSGMTAFLTLLTQDLVANSKTKIMRSNLSKARNTVQSVIIKISALREGTYCPIVRQLTENAQKADERLNTALESLKARLKIEAESAVDAFRNTTREKIYEVIEKDISNDEFKDALDACIKKQHSSLEKCLPEQLKKELEIFREEVSGIITRFQQFAGEIVSTYSSLKIDNNFDLKIDIDNGLKLTSLIATLAGSALLFWNPVGWLVLAPALAGMAFAAYKAVRSFFSSGYKMSQQRKSADENLEKVEKSIRSSIFEGLEKAYPELDSKVAGLKTMLKEPAQQASEIERVLHDTVTKLTALSYSLIPEGEK